MPRRDGIDAASEIAGKRIAPIVVLTAFSQRELVERARDAGAMAYLVKPFSITDLIPAIEVAVSRFSEISRAGARGRQPVGPAGDPQARRTRQGFAAGQAGDDRTRGVQVDSARGHGPADHHEAGRRGRAGDPRRAGDATTAFLSRAYAPITPELRPALPTHALAMGWLCSTRSVDALADVGRIVGADANTDPEVKRARSRDTECICSR